MKQVFLSGQGAIGVLDAPVPGRMRDSILVRNACSLISSGTEGAAVTRKSGLLGIYEKARGSRDRVEQVWAMVQAQGLARTWDAVSNKLQDFTPIGYSSAGMVVEVDDPELPFRPGDLVACMGTGFASHAEYVAVPKNLTVKLPEGVAPRHAAFAALACIAMQGIRRLDLTPGERVGVVGLGLIGQLCVRLLNAMGYRAYGVDLNPRRVEKARAVAGVEAWALDAADSAAYVRQKTNGEGLDGVVVCAASKSDDPVNLAFDLCRRGGRVAIVGDVGLRLERAKMYRKELDLRMSCSYGPGRYDNEYEIEGRDYALAHVRWPEGRNLEHFLHLLASGRLDVEPLATAVFPIADAVAAYARIKEGDPDLYGVLLDYGPLPERPEPPAAALRTVRAAAPAIVGEARIGIGLIGVGGYARGMHLPNLKKLDQAFALRGLASRSGASAAAAAKRFGVPMATSDYRELLADPAIQAVLVATRHTAHARIVLDALEAGKHVYVEKPMTTRIDDGQAIVARAAETGLTVRVGFNRRFSPYMAAFRRALGTGGARMVTMRVNIGALGEDWSNTEEEGGRLLGEGVHFFDLANWLIGAEPDSVAATFAGEAGATNPNAMVTLAYPGGSVVAVTYAALGHKSMGKEYFEGFGNGRSVRSDDFNGIAGFGAAASVARGRRGDKGQLAALAEFADAVRGRPAAAEGADARAGLLATWAGLAAVESGRIGTAVQREI